jgi:hypothetical protein
MDMKKKTETQALRRVLVILTNRFTPLKPGVYVEVECNSKGDILAEKTLKKEPKEAVYDEVWINDEGKKSLSDCTSFKRVYRHKLERRK